MSTHAALSKDGGHAKACYLYGRKYFVHSLFGVPQGSVIALILFNLYVAGMSGIVINCKYLQYVDELS